MSDTPARAEIPADLKAAIDREVESLVAEMTEMRRHLHRHPEISWEERETMRYLSHKLDEAGLEHQTELAGTGICLDIKGAEEGPLTGYRADMDAIALADGKQDVEYASTHAGVMHACGHDFHMAVAFGVLKVLDRLKDRLRGGVRVFFQPAEEVVPAGSASMIEHGVMEGVSAVYAIHVEPAMPQGTIGLRYGAVTASADMFDLLIRGRSGHSSRPFMAIDAILIATKVIDSVYQLVSQRADPLESAVVNVGTIHGGDAANVICGHVRITGALRCFDPVLRSELQSWMSELVGGIVRGMGGEFELNFHKGSPPLFNSPQLVDLVRGAAIDVVGEENLVVVERASMGGEDFSWYAELCDAAMIRVGIATPDSDAQLHNELFDAGDAMLGPAARVMLRALFARNMQG